MSDALLLTAVAAGTALGAALMLGP